MTSTAAAADTAGKTGGKQKGTEYVVLKDVSDDRQVPRWEEGLTIRAASAEAAVRSAGLTGDGYYLAIPKRSYRPLRIRTETKTVVTLEAAK